MNPMIAFTKKEFLEVVRTGKLIILLLVFVLFGIMNPAIAKLTPWMMDIFAETMAESGMVLTGIQVDAMTSWAQFFKNMPIALIVFILIFSDIFTKEYKSGTLLLMLTKGLERYKVVLSKTVLLMSVWSFGYLLCFTITYGYNAYFWDNSIASHLFLAAFLWWLFGIWVICLLVLFSSLLQNNTGVLLCAGGTVLGVYLLSILPKARPYTPTVLMDTVSLLSNMEEIQIYTKAAVITVITGIIAVSASIPAMNKNKF